MVYAEVFESCKFADFREQDAYIDYRKLAGTLKRLKVARDPATPAVLLQQVHAELHRVRPWAAQRAEELCDVAEQLRRDCVSQSRPSAELAQRARALERETLRFHEARCLNADALLRIAERFRTYTLLPPGPQWTHVERGADLFDQSLDRVWYCLSAAYSHSRGDDAGMSQVNAEVGSQDFVRRSVKYWVHPQDLPFVIAQVVRHLPLSAVKDTYDKGDPCYNLGSDISSVYFDNASFGMYHKRMRRLEGSSLFRVRWYGNEEAVLANPETEVFAELKVHHEAWSGEASTKRRFALRSQDVDRYLAGSMSLNAHVEKLREKGAKERDVQKFQRLAVQMLTTVAAEQLRPALRTEYKRCAFQRGKDQSVRVSIDTQLRMRAEDLGASKHWMSEEECDPRHVVDFPYAVVEVKLQCAETDVVPLWVEDLMKCRYMESVPKFSKYAHGVSTLFGSSAFVRLFPYWLHQTAVDIRASTKVEWDQLDTIQGLASGPLHRTIDTAIFGTQPPQAPRDRSAEEATSLRQEDGETLLALYRQMAATASVALAAADASRRNSVVNQTEGEGDHLLPADGPAPSPGEKAAAKQPLHLRHSTYATSRVWACQQRDAAAAIEEAGCCGEEDGGGSNDMAFGAIPGQTAKRVKVPQRFDPKTFFTAERYFLRWTQSAVMLALSGLFVIHFADVGNLPLFGSLWHSRSHAHVGAAMVGVAILALMYALVQFHARSRRVYARVKVRFDDERGPAALMAFTMLGLCIVGSIHVQERFGHLALL